MKSPIIKKISELRTVCEPIEDIDGEGLLLTDKLFDILEKEDGIGLAANQIGINKRACVICYPEKDPDTGDVYWLKRRFINPEVVELKDPFIFTKEGCLSFPNAMIMTLRYAEVLIKDSLNPDGLRMYNLGAVVAQHEIDHLDGITMYDRKKKAIKVNGACPCKSGKKFKKCCMIGLKEREVY